MYRRLLDTISGPLANPFHNSIQKLFWIPVALRFPYQDLFRYPHIFRPSHYDTYNRAYPTGYFLTYFLSLNKNRYCIFQTDRLWRHNMCFTIFFVFIYIIPYISNFNKQKISEIIPTPSLNQLKSIIIKKKL